MTKNVQTLEDIRLALTQVIDILSKNTTKDIDLKGRRVTGAADADDDTDYVTLKDLKKAIAAVTLIFVALDKKLGNAFYIDRSDIVFNKGNVVINKLLRRPAQVTGDPTAMIDWILGSGDPEGVVIANVGSLYSRIDGGVGSSLYVKETGSDENGWAAK